MIVALEYEIHILCYTNAIIYVERYAINLILVDKLNSDKDAIDMISLFLTYHTPSNKSSSKLK